MQDGVLSVCSLMQCQVLIKSRGEPDIVHELATKYMCSPSVGEKQKG